MQDIKPVAVAKEPCRFDQIIAAETDRIATDLVDLEPLLAAIEAYDVTTIALTHDLRIMDVVIEFNANGNWKRRRQCSSAPPRRRGGIGNTEQQRRKSYVPGFRACTARKQIVTMLADESCRRFASGECGMPQASGEKRLIGRYAECRRLFEGVDELAPSLVAGRAMS